MKIRVAICLFLVPSIGLASEPIDAKRIAANLAYDNKDYETCGKLFVELAKAAKDNRKRRDAYDAACCLALVGKKDDAFAQLGVALETKLTDVEHLKTDPDLVALRGDPRWKSVVARAQANRDAYLRSVSRELYELYAQDQADRRNDMTKVDWSVVSARDAERRKRVSQILAAGGAKIADDFYHAAMVFQHGEDVKDYEKVRELALKAVELDPNHASAKWLAAAGEDRRLMTLGKQQAYGTQFKRVNGKWILWDVDPTVTDEERAKWNVPPLAEAKRRAEAMNAAE